MFAVISIENEKKKMRRRQTRIEAIQTPVRGGAPFRIVAITKGRKEIDWHRVAEAASCGSRNLLVPDGFVLPDSPYLKLFEADTLPLLITLNTAVKK